MASPRYTASIDHSEKTIERLYRTQRRTYDRGRIFLRLALGFGMVLAAALAALPTWLKAILLLVGAWLMASGDFPAQIRADRAVQDRGGSLPKMRYEFYEDHLKLTGEGSMNIGYRKLNRLLEDREFYYLFLERDSVCMIDRESLKPAKQEDFRLFLENATGLNWRQEKSFLSIDLADLIKMRREKKRNQSDRNI